MLVTPTLPRQPPADKECPAMFGSFSHSWEVLRQSYAVLQRQKTLVLLPILSGVACTLVAASFIIPVLLLFPNLFGGAPAGGQPGVAAAVQQNNVTEQVAWGLGLFVYYFVN